MKKHKFELPEQGLTPKQKERKIIKAAKAYAKYMDVLLPGWQQDDNSKNTPMRVAKAFVEDIGRGLYTPPPKITTFENAEVYKGIVLQANIPVKSLCSHHHQNIFGIAHVAYLPNPEKYIGLSKLNRIVEYVSRTPQVQENMTQQIHDYINDLVRDNGGVAVIITAKHMCVSHRGVNQDSDMSTAVLSGAFFNDDKVRSELYKLIEYSKK
jgi:GTP cyclohydrolase I